MEDDSIAAGEFRQLFFSNPQALFVCDAVTHEILEVNDAASRAFGVPRERLVGGAIIDFIDEEDRPQLEERLAAKALDAEVWGPWLFHATEEDFLGVCDRRSVQFAGRAAFIVHVRDVTTEIDRERQLKESEQRYDIALRGANDGIWDWDLVGNRVYYSPRFCELLGYEQGELGDSPEGWFEKVHPEDIDQLMREIDLHQQRITPRLKAEYRVRHKLGHDVWMLTRGVAVFEGDRAVRMAGSQTDINDLKANEERILQGAFYDRLTGLANRSLFMDRLSFLVRRAITSAEYGFTVLFIDLDRFKMVNESYGHESGDTLLAEAGTRFARTVSAGDTLARLGGDEYGVILDGVADVANSIHHAQALLDEFSEPFSVGGDEVVLHASIGVAVNDGRYMRSDDLLRDADTAMYRAKSKGRARYEVFDEAMHQEAVAILRLETDIRRGITAGEFQLFYQPIISLNDGAIVGSEALVRWNHPERGLVGPVEFIPVAEESGLIVSLGEWIMYEACRQSREWIDQGLKPGSVSVNLSAHQFKSGLVQELIRGALESAGLEGHHLHVELTESAVMDDPEQAIAIFRELEKLGVHFVIDDFGTGYSSLSYLKRLRVGSLKIDRSFVKDLATDAENAALVAAVIALSHSFRAQCVGEGVETTEQLSFLRLLKCDLAQGYLFSRPVPAPEFAEMLRSGVKGWHRLLF
jgi:diguanylate cyclase (GGDEF)-like protein/PAS domain S-box-containing protein